MRRLLPSPVKCLRASVGLRALWRLFAKPILRAPEQGDANKPAYFELCATVLYGEQALVGLPGRGVEYRTSGPSVAVLLQIPENPHPKHRLSFLSPPAAIAGGIRVLWIGIHQLLDSSEQLAAFLPDKHHRLRFTRNVVDGLPAPYG